MAGKPNVHSRTREVGWLFGNTNGSLVNNNANGQNHGSSPALASGSSGFVFIIQTAHGLAGGAAILSRGFVIPNTLEPTRTINQVKSTTALYLSISAHLRSAGDVDLPARVNLYTNDLWPTEAAVANPLRSDLGDWVTNAGVSIQGWQEWEEWSPFTIPNPPPGFTGGGATGVRYEHRRYIGRLQSNFLWASITNIGSVSATEWGISCWLSSHPRG